MAAPAPQYGNYVLGKGKIFTAIALPDGSYKALRYVGTSKEFNISSTVETYDYYTGDCGPSEKVVSVNTQTNRTVTLVLDDNTWENSALALGGEVDTVSRSASTVADESFAGLQVGYHYALGVTEEDPLGVFGTVSDVVVKKAAATLVEGTDYMVNYSRGIVHVLPGGALDEGDTMLVSYKVVAEESVRLEAGAEIGQKIKLVFFACNEEGENRDVVIPLISLRPSGSIAFRGTEVQTLSFEGDILKHPFLPTIIVDGKAAA